MDHRDTDPQEGRASDREVTSMHIREEALVGARREVVWSILTRRLDDWWRHPYRIQEGDGAMNLQLGPHGSLTERWGKDGFATWGQVSLLEPGSTLELTGPCGMGAVHGVFSFHLEERDDGVLLTLTHDAFGVIREEIQGDYEEAWRMMLLRLKELAEGELAYGADARTI